MEVIYNHKSVTWSISRAFLYEKCSYESNSHTSMRVEGDPLDPYPFPTT